MEKIQVGLFVFENLDLMDLIGPKEVFHAVRQEKKGGRSSDKILQLYDSESVFSTKIVSFDSCEYVRSADGTKLIPDISFKDIKNLDDFRVWVIPGGKGVHEIRSNPEYVGYVREAIDHAFMSLAVCTGAYLVAETGFLENDLVTTHWRHLELFQEQFPQLRMANNARYSLGNKVITTAGVTAGIDGALALVKLIVSENAARDAAELINYPWLD